MVAGKAKHSFSRMSGHSLHRRIESDDAAPGVYAHDALGAAFEHRLHLRFLVDQVVHQLGVVNCNSRLPGKGIQCRLVDSRERGGTTGTHHVDQSQGPSPDLQRQGDNRVQNQALIGLGQWGAENGRQGVETPGTHREVRYGLVQKGEEPFKGAVIQTVGVAGDEAMLLIVPSSDDAGAAAEGRNGVSEDHGQCGPEVSLLRQSI